MAAGTQEVADDGSELPPNRVGVGRRVEYADGVRLSGGLGEEAAAHAVEIVWATPLDAVGRPTAAGGRLLDRQVEDDGQVWQKITGNPRQSHYVLGDHLFVLLDSFNGALGTVYDSSDRYTPMDVAYVRGLMEEHPHKYVWLLAHWFEMEEETEAFRQLVRDPRVKGLFMGHSHDHRLIPLGPEYDGKYIAQTGNFSYTMSGAHTGGFWGFRDLRIRGSRATSSYIMAESTVILEGEAVTFGRRVSEVAAYEL
jgi:hypothetical protein